MKIGFPAVFSFMCIFDEIRVFWEEFIDKNCIYVYNHTRIRLFVTEGGDDIRWRTEKFF